MAKFAPEFNINSPAQVIREQADVGGWYGRNLNRFNLIEKVGFIGAYTNSDGAVHVGRQISWISAMPERVRRHFINILFESYDRKHIK